MFFLRLPVDALRLKNRANHAPSIPHDSHVSIFLPCLIGLSVIKNKPEWHLKNSIRGRRYGLTLNQRNTKVNMLGADMKNKKDG